MYSEGSVVGAASIIDPEISPTPSEISQAVRKCEIWRHFRHHSILSCTRWNCSNISELNKKVKKRWLSCVHPKFSEVQFTHPWEPFVGNAPPTPPPKIGKGSVLNRQRLSRTLADCREIWQDDATQDCGGSGVLKIHFWSTPKLPEHHYLCEIRIPASSPLAFEPPAFRNKAILTNLWNKFGEHDDRSMFSPSLMKFDPRTPENSQENLGKSASP